MAQAAKSLKFGWLSARGGAFCSRALLLAPVAFALAGAASDRPARFLFSGGQWAAIDFGQRCEARSRALWRKQGTEPLAGFAFDSAGRRQGQFYARLSRPARAGSSVIATIGSTPFLLVGRGEWAWSRAPAQNRALLEAARFGQSMRIEARDMRGRRVVDRYLLVGAATAIDSAAAACAGKRR